MLVLLMGFLGLATDVGYLLFKKRLAQTAADAGAVYGTQAFRRGKSDAVIEATAVQGAEDSCLSSRSNCSVGFAFLC